MGTNLGFFKALFLFFYRFVFRQSWNLKGIHRSISNIQSRYHKYPSLLHRFEVDELSNKTLIFDVEGALLKSPSLFPYFMLVAFEAGSVLRAILLFALYPLISLVGEEMGLKIMVMVCFFGIKKKSFRVGSAVLPKFFLEDVGLEVFEVLRKGGRKVGVSDLPQVMIEGFLRDYLEVDLVLGRKLKVVSGYFVGIMEDNKKAENIHVLGEMLNGEDANSDFSDAIGITSFNKSDHHQLFSYCKEIYLVRRADKRSWQYLPRENYPKPLIFHDGRLALRPTPLATLTLFMWIPLGFILAIIRAVIALSLPHTVSIPMLVFSGLHITITEPNNNSNKPDHHNNAKGVLYVCNHRTLLDPLYLSFSLKKNLTAVTYSLSRVSEILSPIKTVRLTRDRGQDGMMMKKLLNQGDLVICPEGTTCREPYLLRFSPLFSEMSEDITAVAMNSHVSMFYGTTAGGLKCLDPLFFLMNPLPSYTVQLLDKLSGSSTCDDGQRTRFDAANHVQNQLGKALGFECTKLTRRDKYLILAGNEGHVNNCRS
ncbi:putative Glycerol-3-phosphate acyltransferase 3 [Tripterygium wilfordii]|uniref:Putative Glycerol-3-phosphate acyltransferase 3 n=1 Tax=Tripterygium wilfordii TaxID=458696 RepID=A0A7J7D9D0_TRIWF|nr:probable glycerol-3-phosphate acyltransferase 3 [Tripterygium wilfordii]KAF5742894.1 putative Glycerol-3-phosphate acyltransferase 3 [Tripterygium wilfordii]